MLCFQFAMPAAGESPDELQVVCDREGLESLLEQLRFLSEGRTDHVHLMAESWGGSHLSDSPSDPSLARSST
jgi:hypothetical protein